PPGSLADYFREQLEPVFGPLFRDPTSATVRGQHIAWILHAAAMDPPSGSVRDAVLAGTPVKADERQLIEAVADLITDAAEETVDDETRIDQLLRAGDLVAAWGVARQTNLTPAARVRALLHVAYEANNPEWAADAIAEAATLATDDTDALAGRT